MPASKTLDWIGADEARERLGVRPQTLYAYVSRGRVQTRIDPRDPGAIADAVRTILEDPARAERMADAGSRASAGSGWDEVARMYAQLAERIVPIRAAALLGAAVMLISMLYVCYSLYAKLFLHISPQGFTG